MSKKTAEEFQGVRLDDWFILGSWELMRRGSTEGKEPNEQWIERRGGYKVFRAGIRVKRNIVSKRNWEWRH